MADNRGRSDRPAARPFSAIITILVLALILQTAYGPQYCKEPSQKDLQGINVDRELTREYCSVSQIRDRNAPVSQWVDTLNYDLVALGDLLSGLFNQIGTTQQPHK
jgi:hypothetical protein